MFKLKYRLISWAILYFWYLPLILMAIGIATSSHDNFQGIFNIGVFLIIAVFLPDVRENFLLRRCRENLLNELSSYQMDSISKIRDFLKKEEETDTLLEVEIDMGQYFLTEDFTSLIDEVFENFNRQNGCKIERSNSKAFIKGKLSRWIKIIEIFIQLEIFHQHLHLLAKREQFLRADIILHCFIESISQVQKQVQAHQKLFEELKLSFERQRELQNEIYRISTRLASNLI